MSGHCAVHVVDGAGSQSPLSRLSSNDHLDFHGEFLVLSACASCLAIFTGRQEFEGLGLAVLVR